MMSRRRVVASITCAAMAGSACVASSGASSSSWFNQDQATASAPIRMAMNRRPRSRAPADPRVRTGAPASRSTLRWRTPTGANLVRANFHLDDDAYVLVGHIDADGVLRIAFPETPVDNGFTHGHASYQSAQFLGGFVGQYRARFTTGGVPHMSGTVPSDSYDGGLGWVFVIASWQPMHFEKFSTGGFWDSFELNDADYMKNPRPAVYELAALLAGTNSSSYTVRFANVERYANALRRLAFALPGQQFWRGDVQRVRLRLLVGFCVDAVRTELVQSDLHVWIRAAVLVARKPVFLRLGVRLLLSRRNVSALRVPPIWIRIRLRPHRAGSANGEPGYRAADRRSIRFAVHRSRRSPDRCASRRRRDGRRRRGADRRWRWRPTIRRRSTGRADSSRTRIRSALRLSRPRRSVPNVALATPATVSRRAAW